jgi:hypothetical protein
MTPSEIKTPTNKMRNPISFRKKVSTMVLHIEEESNS